MRTKKKTVEQKKIETPEIREVRTKRDIHNRASALETTRGFLHHLNKSSWTLVHKRLKLDRHFYPPSVNFAVLLHSQASQTTISKQNLTKLCQTVGSKSRQQSAVKKSGSSLSKNWRPKTLYIYSVFRRLRYLMTNNFWTKEDRQSGKGVKMYEGSPTSSKNFMNFGPQTG